VRRLALQIEHELQDRGQRHCAVYENELQRVWPLNEKDREAKIAQFAKKYGFRLRHYKKGLCAIFDKQPAQSKQTKLRRYAVGVADDAAIKARKSRCQEKRTRHF
jgi:hypothetical protein